MRSNLITPFTLLTISSGLALATACSPAAWNSGLTDVSPLGSKVAATVTIHNQQASDIRVYVVAGSAEHRLGLVTALSTATFRIPSVVPSPSDLRFRAVPLASGEPQSTDMITVFAGNSLVFTIGHGPATSNLVLRR